MTIKYESYKDKANKAIEEGVTRALEAVGSFVVGETTERSPVKTGHLKGSYDYKTHPEEKMVQIGTPVDYAIFVEKGTYKMDAQPHLTPAVEDNIPRIISLVKEMMAID